MIRSAMARARVAALVLLAVSLALVGIGVVWPLSGYLLAQYREQDRSLDRIARARARASELTSVAAAFDAARSDPLWQRAYRDPTAASALGRFELEARSALGAAGSRAIVEKLPPTASGTLTELGARIRLSIPADQLADCLERIERAPQLMRIRLLKVESPLTQRDDRNELLDVTLEVVGYWVARAGERST